MLNTITCPTWQKLQAHYQDIVSKTMSEWFAQDPNRFQRFSLETAGIFLDYSKNRLQSQTLDLLLELAKVCQLPQRIEDLFTGKIVNRSENRPALHTALRYSGRDAIKVGGTDIMPAIRETLNTVRQIANSIRAHQYFGYNGQAINTILHFGIGGSDLGPLMVFEALNADFDPSLHYQFFSYQDPDYVQQCLVNYNPATTLIIIASKSFTTTETLANAAVAKNWLLVAAPKPDAVAPQIIAVTAKADRAIAFGVAPEQVLPVWDWVGGRYSVWSAMSLVVAIAIGFERFQDFLAGAEKMDQHFRQADFAVNMPVLLGLIDVWYNNFFAIPSRAIIPYGRALRYFPDHLQQVYMESLGKSVDQQGQPVDYATGFTIWGGTGSNSQHSFHQMLLQGNQWSPIDFILPLDNKALVANGLAQSQVLMAGYTPPTQSALTSAQTIAGNRPSNTLLLPKLTPYVLGALMALYEHRVYVSSVIWDINAFDQWGVERGKLIAQQILATLTTAVPQDYDSSTLGLINWIRQSHD